MGRIVVSNLGKAYKQYPSKWARLAEWLDPHSNSRHKEHWVLRDISFTVNPGEAVGIIGVNGAGKSTLLKMITGTTMPTEGSVQTTGHIAALLELGMGFHPDFTGRQNVYMAAQLAGIDVGKMDNLMPTVEAFAEIGPYIDQPLRTYSSGMQVRLAFSAATVVRPDILIVDEALAVGDAYFQHKCTEKIREFIDEGTTLLFVSHSPGAVKSLCNRAIMLAGGGLVHDGPPDEVIDHYNALIAKRTHQHHINIQKGSDGRAITRSGSGDAVITASDIIESGKSARAIASGSAIEIVISAKIERSIGSLCVGILIRDRFGIDVWGTNTFHLGSKLGPQTEGDVTQFKFHVPNLYLAPGSYSISAALHADENHLSDNYNWVDRLLTFEVTRGLGPVVAGVCNFPVNFSWESALEKEHAK